MDGAEITQLRPCFLQRPQIFPVIKAERLVHGHCQAEGRPGGPASTGGGVVKRILPEVYGLLRFSRLLRTGPFISFPFPSSQCQNSFPVQRPLKFLPQALHHPLQVRNLIGQHQPQMTALNVQPVHFRYISQALDRQLRLNGLF